MADVIVFPDVVAVVRSYLHDELETRDIAIHVGAKVPMPRPDRFITVRRQGGPRANLVVDNAQIRVESWADLEEDAADLAELARGLLLAMRGTVQGDVTIYRVTEFSGPQLLPDPESGQPRYMFTHQIAARGRAEMPGS